jgi:hypothetical protein
MVQGVQQLLSCSAPGMAGEVLSSVLAEKLTDWWVDLPVPPHHDPLELCRRVV